MAADMSLRVLQPFGDGEEAALHLEGGGWFGTAIVVRRIGELGFGVVERPPSEKERRALGGG
jgi:hypothetical protein